jgi:glycosyltransferase involved in cell wall biosynthesis
VEQSKVVNLTSTQYSPNLSVVIPFYNESGNVLPLLSELQDALKTHSGKWEVIAVNDGSRDSTAQELEEAKQIIGDHLHVIEFARNFGQTAAMQCGIDSARGDFIVTLDGDRQNDPADIPAMLQYMLESDLDMVAGWRKNRQDAEINRKLPSRIANWIIRRATGVRIHDYGCSLKLFRASVIKQVVLMGEMHRFIPAWVASVTDPSRIGEMEVNHRARETGVSKYGLSRTFRVIIDLISVFFFMRFSRKPGHFFGSIGLISGSFGGAILFYLLSLKIFFSADIGNRPLLFTGILLVVVGIQMLTTGVVAEMQTRNSGKQSYSIRNNQNQDRSWHDYPSS